MSLKRARAQLSGSGYGLEDSWVGEDEKAASAAAGAKFRSFLLERYTEGSITASDCCLLAYYHTESGGEGAEDLALGPDQSTTHGSSHLKRLKLQLILTKSHIFNKPKQTPLAPVT